MKYYLVALFDDESYKNLTPIQRNFSKKFRANRSSPAPYIPLEVVENPNVDKLDLVIEKIVKPYKYFKVQMCNQVSISETHKTLNVKIEDRGYIKRLNRLMNDTLKLYGFNIKNHNNEVPMYISLANLNYIPKDIKKTDGEVSFKSNFDTLKVNRIELWKVSNNKKETIIKSYPLKKSI
ncbi:2'-5' RNA ligase family protein [Clostridium carnis]